MAAAGQPCRVAADSGRRFLNLGHAPLHLGGVKFRSRLFTALNLLPSIATLACVSRPIRRQSSTNRTQTWRMARPLSLRKSAIVL